MQHVESALAAGGERVLLVETSGLPAFERTRAFYRKLGYTEEACIREFYRAGEDKIIFRKALDPHTLPTPGSKPAGLAGRLRKEWPA